LSIDSENHLFSALNKEYLCDFENMISRKQLNDRRKLLFENTEQARKLMSERLNIQSNIFAIDSIPLETCKAERNKMSEESAHYAPGKGYSASKKKYFFRYKLHSVCSAAGMIES
jgi:hypothetical protein